MEKVSSGNGLYKRLLLRGVIIALGLVFVALVLPRAVRMLLPFVIAFVVAMLLNPLVTKLNKRLKTSRRIIALVLDLLVFFAASTLVFLLVNKVIHEAVTLATNILNNWDAIAAKLGSLDEGLAWLDDLLPPEVVDFLSRFEESIIGLVKNGSKNLLTFVMNATAKVTTKTGSFVMTFVMAVLAAYFTVADYNLITQAVKKRLGARLCRYLSILKSAAGNAFGRYFKAQLSLAFLAFVIMFAALGIYGQSYALLIALFLGFIDLLPIVGTIAVLLPWGIIEFLVGDVGKGLFLVILGVAFFLLRKVVEPKIVGDSTGLHPLMALMSTYVGLQFSGVWGAILGPVLVMMALSIFKSGIFDGTVRDLRLWGDRLSKILTSR